MPERRNCLIDSLDTWPFSPGSHSTGMALSAWLARHQLSATTATQSGPATTRLTPRMPFTFDSS
jgi:hypothetical protein